MPSGGLALTFDPDYLTAAIDAWRRDDLAPITLPDLERSATRLLRERFVARNIMGMRERAVSAVAVTRALGVLTSLKLARKTTTRRGETRVTQLAVTTAGRATLEEDPIEGALYPRLAECLSTANADIHRLLELLAEHGPFTQPILHLMPGAPTRGAAYQAAIKAGLQEYQSQVEPSGVEPQIAFEPTISRPTPAQRIRSAQTWAAQIHPAGALAHLDKAVSTSLAFGLLWVDVTQINEAVGAKSIGVAATETVRGFRPNIIKWPGNTDEAISALTSAVNTRANGSGFATIQDVRGALGCSLNLSPIAVDALLREVRDAGDRHEIPIELHFEPDEDQLYANERDPLVWHQQAFEFITVMSRARA